VDISPEFMARLEDMRSYDILKTFMDKLRDRELSTPEDVKVLAKEIQKELSVKPKEIWHSLRIAMTGQLEGVGIDVLLSTLPKERIIYRIERVLERIS
jgi:glutamyl-tRNA synthetase/nondiscriminating glutamyl-tRNA synthetase